MKNEFFDFKYWRKVLTGSPTRKRLTGNFFSLSVLQALNYILPLITLPYLVRVLGPEKYGLISFAQAFIGYFAILTDYGFSLSATREISINRENKEKVSEIFSSVMIIKIFLGILSFVILGLVLLSVPKFGNEWLLYIFTFGTVLGNILFPVWFFQGVENMKWITILNVIARSIFTVLIFVFVHKESDYLNVVIINSLGSIVAGIISLIVVFKNFKIKFILLKFESIKYQLKKGWYLFISSASANLVSGSNTFILGLFTNNTIVGYYAGAEKIIKAVLSIVSIISTTLFPYINKQFLISKEKTLKLLRKILKLNVVLGVCISSFMFIFSPWIIRIVLGPEFSQSIIILRILSIIMFLIISNNIAGVQTMVPLGYQKDYFRIIFMGGIINILLSIILCQLLYHIGAAISWTVSEIIITVLMFLFLKSKGINYFAFNFNKKI